VHGFTAAFGRLDDAGLRADLGRRLGLAAAGAPAVVLLAQPHGAEIADLDGGGWGGAEAPLAGVDGATAGGGAARLLVVKAADCVPVLAVDAARGRYAALHAGWRGAAAGILPNLLRLWGAEGAAPEGVRLALGPHIRDCCFAVQADCLERFQPRHLAGAVRDRDGATFLALEAVLRAQAAEFGIGPERIEALPDCTACARDAAGRHPFASHRRDHRAGRPVGRNLSFIGIRSAAMPQPHGANP
jgi:hypothetical protein